MFGHWLFQGHKLFIIATTSRKDVLQEMELLNTFNNVVHVSSITAGEELVAVIDNLDVFSKEELEQLKKRVNGKK